MENDLENATTVVLDGVATQSFGLDPFVTDNDKSGLQVMKFGAAGKRTFNYVIPVSTKSSTNTIHHVNVDPNTAVDPNTLTKTSFAPTRLVRLASAEGIGRATTSSLGGGVTTNNDGEAIHVLDSGRQGEMPSSVTVIQDALAHGRSNLMGTLPNNLSATGVVPCTVPSNPISMHSALESHTHVIGSVPGSIESVAECLKIVPTSSPLDEQMVNIPCTVSTSRHMTISTGACSSTIAGLNPHASMGPISTTLSQDGISALGDHHRATLQGLGGVVSSVAGCHATTLGTLTLSDSVCGVTGTLGSDSDVTLAGPVPVETVSLVNISVPNVELTTSGQLLISQGSLVYAQQGNNLVAVPSHMVDGQIPQASTASVPLQQQGEQPPKKKKGGWPKGKKRKIDPLKEANAPRKPTSAYTLFLNEQRPKLKEKNSLMHFSEITKVLGNQWSGMTPEDKQKYFTAADVDKKRYIDELKAYQQTETYQALIKRQLAKKLKNIVGSNGDPLDCDVSNSMLSELQLDDDDPSDLFCRTCDQYFSSVHNKREHIYGKQHLVTLALKLCEIEKETEQIEQQALSLETVPDTAPVMDAHAELNVTDLTPDLSLQTRPISEPVNIEQFKDDFVELNHERENEIRELHKHQQEVLDFNLQLSKQLKDFGEVAEKLESDLKNLKAIGSSLQTQLDGLRMVPTLFGVINF